MRGVFPAQGEWNFDAFVDDALEKAPTERQAVAFNRNQVERSVVDLDRLACLVERLLELVQVIGRDAADVIRRDCVLPTPGSPINITELLRSR
jgi:hypothetical protein